jgi:hypothetical protein
METNREDISVLINGGREWWTVGMEIWDDEDPNPPIRLFVTYAGITQDTMPPAVAAEAVQIWSRWLAQR